MGKNIEYIGLGYCSNDVLCVVPEIPMDSKVQIITHSIQGGGPAGTAAVAAARLGMRTAMMSVAGDDDAGKQIRAGFADEKVDVSNLLLRTGKSSPIAYCWIEESTGNRSVAWARGTAPELKPEEVDEKMIRNAKVLHLDGHQTVAAIRAAEIAHESGVLVNFDAGTMRPGVEKLLELADILFASEQFARTYTKTDDPYEAVKKFAAAVPAKVAGLTMGRNGSLAVVDGKVVHVPAFTIRAVDTTGAGDVFHTGFAVRYCETGDVEESMKFGSAVSALKCLKLGGRAGIPTYQETMDFIQQHTKQEM